MLEFATSTYDANFPMFAKIDVNGDGAAPLYQYLTAEQPNDDGTTEIPWNFTKFLVDRSGAVVKRYSPVATPEDISSELDSVLT